MKLIIHQILLYPKDPSLSVRAVNFEPGRVNVITGTSARGKSAIAHIIDYCLGAEKCAVPVGVIRETVAWYALVLEVDTGLMFVARREPGQQQSTDDYCVIERNDLALPREVEKNTNRDAFKARMDELCGLPNLGFSAGESHSGYSARASFRDMAAFNFLPQHIVANPQTLFAKTDRTEHREKLRRVLPLVLGAIDASYLRAEHEEAELRKRLQRLQDELDRRQQAADTWRAELFGFLARARELGIVQSEFAQPTDTSQVVALFRQILRSEQTYDRPALRAGNTEGALQQLAGLNEQEAEAAARLGDARRQLRRIQSLSNSVTQYSNQLGEESLRVVGAGWFEKRLSDLACPFCGSANDRAAQEVKSLQRAAEELKGLSVSAQEAPEVFGREEADLRIRVRVAEEELQSIREERWQLEEASREAAQARQRMSEVYRFVGRVEQAISNVEDTEEGGELPQRIADLRRRLSELQKVLDPESVRQRLTAALTRVSRLIQPIAVAMRLERSEDVIRLQPRELTLIFQNEQGREDYLWEVGSGENWMGYHIATLRALHEFFLSRARSPVPAFLIVDQPSQVYFPARHDAYDEARQEANPTEAPDGDFAKARRIFEALALGVQNTNGALQIIVTEHADELTWGSIDGVRMVENWRGPNSLIPSSWLA